MCVRARVCLEGGGRVWPRGLRVGSSGRGAGLAGVLGVVEVRVGVRRLVPQRNVTYPLRRRLRTDTHALITRAALARAGWRGPGWAHDRVAVHREHLRVPRRISRRAQAQHHRRGPDEASHLSLRCFSQFGNPICASRCPHVGANLHSNLPRFVNPRHRVALREKRGAWPMLKGELAAYKQRAPPNPSGARGSADDVGPTTSPGASGESSPAPCVVAQSLPCGSHFHDMASRLPAKPRVRPAAPPSTLSNLPILELPEPSPHARCLPITPAPPPPPHPGALNPPACPPPHTPCPRGAA